MSEVSHVRRVRPKRRGAHRATLGLLVITATTTAAANGRFPLATQVVVAPNDAQHLTLRSTFGIVETSDGGGTWQWICEQAAGYSDVADPTLAVTADGTLLVGSERLRSSADHGCAWSAPPSFPAVAVTDLAVDPARPERVVALSTTSDAAGSFVNRLFESVDNGRTWATMGQPIADGLIAETVDVAQGRVYLSGKFWPSQSGVLERSDDGGATWERHPIDVAGSELPFIAAVDPNDADRVYVRSSAADSDGLFVTTDAGSTWARIFTTTGGLLGFALAPDGQSLAVGGPKAGVNVAPVASYQFERASDVGVYCLRWTDAGIYACGAGGDGATLGFSNDRGATFAKVLDSSSIAPLVCAPDSTTASTCALVWPQVAAVLGADAGLDGSKSSVPDPSLNPIEETTPSGCRCDLGRRSTGNGVAALLALACLAAGTGRRKFRPLGSGYSGDG